MDFDLTDLYGEDDGTVQQKAQAMAAALRKQQALGQALQLTGHSTAAPLGQSLQVGAQRDLGQMAGVLERRPERQQKIQDARMQNEPFDAQTAQAFSKMIPVDLQKVRRGDASVLVKAMDTAMMADAKRFAAMGAIRDRESKRDALENDAEAIGDAIIRGEAPPELKGATKVNAGVRAYLSRQGFDLAKAQQEWAATSRHIATLNSPQQERLRQALDFTGHGLDLLESSYDTWKQIAPVGRFKVFNRMALEASKQLGGEVGAAAQALETQIADLTGELGNVYMGGNSPTDRALKLASENLRSSWDEKTFKRNLEMLRATLKLRRNAMMNSAAAVSGGGASRYEAAPPGASAKADPVVERAKQQANLQPGERLFRKKGTNEFAVYGAGEQPDAGMEEVP